MALAAASLEDRDWSFVHRPRFVRQPPWIRAVSASLLLLTDAGAGRAPLARWRRSLLVPHCSLGVDVDALAPAPRAVTAGASFSNFKPGPQSESRSGCRLSTGVPTYGWRSCTRACRPGCGCAMLAACGSQSPAKASSASSLGVTCGAGIGWGSAVMAQPRGGGRRNPVEVGASPAVHASMGRDGIGCFLRTMA
jgi:hypothetical protein